MLEYLLSMKFHAEFSHDCDFPRFGIFDVLDVDGSDVHVEDPPQCAGRRVGGGGGGGVIAIAVVVAAEIEIEINAMGCV